MKIKPFAVLASVLLSAAPLAHAESFFQIEAGAGATHYETLNGRWYQNGMPDNNVSRRNVALSVGAVGPVLARGRWGIDWHFDYVNLGRAAASCHCTPVDANYDPATNRYEPIVNAPLSYFTGNGRSQGFILSIESYYWVRGVRVGAEVGAYVNRATWNEDVYDWAWSYDTPRTNLHISTRQWGVVPVVGASVGNGAWSVGYRHYFTSRQHLHESSPPLWTDINVIELQYRF